MKRATKWASMVLAALALAYFVRHALRTLEGKDLSALLHGPGLVAMMALVVMYTASIATTSAAWLWQLRAMRQPSDFRWTTTVLAVTQFGKYLPGNVGQHIGRVGLAIDSGVRLPAALLTVGYELLIALVAASHLCAISALLWPPQALAGGPWLEYRWTLVALATVGTVTGLLLAPWLTALLVSKRQGDKPATAVDARAFALNLPAIAGSYVMYVGSLSAIGIGLWILALALVSGAPVPPPLFFIGAFATSWIAGFVVPGAPAGLGVREVVLTAWLSGALPPAIVVIIVVALRVATSIGDGINFAWGSWALSRRRHPARGRRP